MAEIQNKFTSDDAEVNRSLENLQKQMAKLREEAAKGNEESKKHHHEMREILKEGKELILGAVPALWTVKGAADFVTEAYKEQRERIREAAHEHRDYANSVVRDLAKIGEAHKADEIEEALGNIAGTPRELARKMRSAAADRMAGVAGGTEKSLAITRALGPVSGLVEPELAAGIAGGAESAFGGKVDAANFGLRAMAAAGGSASQLPDLFGRVQQLVSAGMSPEQATALAIEDLRQNQSPKALTSLAESIDKDVKKVKPTATAKGATKFGHPQRFEPLSPTDQAVNRFADADRAERLRLLMSDRLTRRGVMGDTGALAFEQFDMDRLSATEQQLGTGGAAEEMLKGAASTKAGRGLLVGQIESKRHEDAKERLAAQGSHRERLEANIQAEQDASGYNWLERGIAGLYRSVGTTALTPFMGEDQAALAVAGGSRFDNPDNPLRRGAEATSGNSAMSAEGLVEALRSNTEALKENTQAVEPGEAPPARRVFVPTGRHEEPR